MLLPRSGAARANWWIGDSSALLQQCCILCRSKAHWLESAFDSNVTVGLRAFLSCAAHFLLLNANFLGMLALGVLFGAGARDSNGKTKLAFPKRLTVALETGAHRTCISAVLLHCWSSVSPFRRRATRVCFCVATRCHNSCKKKLTNVRACLLCCHGIICFWALFTKRQFEQFGA